MVVPIFAPSMTAMAWGMVISLAATNPMTITVVAELDCMSAVTSAPISTPMMGFPVRTFNIFLSLSPAIFFSPELISFIPKIKIASPPNRPNNISTVVLIESPEFKKYHAIAMCQI